MAIDKIGSAAITDCTVVAADIAPGTITNAKLAGSIANAKLANSSVTINGSSISLGASGSIPAVSWQSVVVSDGSTVTTMVAGRGYFIDNTSAAGLVQLPSSASAGDTIAIKDYAGNFGTNSLTIQRNSHKIQGNTNDSEVTTDRASVTLVYVDATKGWLFVNESNVTNFGPQFIQATGGTVTESGDFKIHTFTGDGCFVVSQIGNSPSVPTGGPAVVDYLVVAGGGGGGGGANNSDNTAAGGGAGGFRESKSPVAGTYTASPLAATTGITVTATTFPISVGAGGAAQPSNNSLGNDGSNSVFSTITSAGGGGGGAGNVGTRTGRAGGSGGGGAGGTPSPGATGGAGNTPPVSPPQGSNGGDYSNTSPDHASAGGGGATAEGFDKPGGICGLAGGPGGTGATTAINGTSTGFAGGGGGGAGVCGCASNNTQFPNGRSPAPGTGQADTLGFGGASGGRSRSFGGGDGTANKGGGGGGGGGSHPNNPNAAFYKGGAGGKGIVIIRYKFQ